MVVQATRFELRVFRGEPRDHSNPRGTAGGGA